MVEHRLAKAGTRFRLPSAALMSGSSNGRIGDFQSADTGSIPVPDTMVPQFTGCIRQLVTLGRGRFDSARYRYELSR